MTVANDINLLGMMNPAVIVTERVKATIGRMFISVDNRARQHAFLNERLQSLGKHVGNYLGNYVAPTLHRSSHDGLMLACSTAFLSAASVATNVGFVNLNTPTQRLPLLCEHGANLFEHAPSGLVGDAKLSLKLLR